MAAMRSYMRDINLGRPAREGIAHAVGMSGQEMEDMYRLLAIAKYEDRYVIPAGHAESAHDLEGTGTDCPLNAPGGPRSEERRVEEGRRATGAGERETDEDTGRAVTRRRLHGRGGHASRRTRA